jgi:hypothetical protein
MYSYFGTAAAICRAYSVMTLTDTLCFGWLSACGFSGFGFPPVKRRSNTGYLPIKEMTVEHPKTVLKCGESFPGAGHVTDMGV